MDSLLELMDFLVKHFGAHRRRHPGPPPVSNIGFLPGKKTRIDYTFPTLNFSFILGGSGTYGWEGRLHRVDPPMVVIQTPGAPMDYGPEPGSTWDELYIVYPAESVEWFRAAGLLRDQRMLWRIREPLRVETLVEELGATASTEDASPDRIDRICERMILESLLGAAEDEGDRATRVVQEIRALIRKQPELPHDFESLAARRGLSTSTFRRAWRDQVGMPPGKWLRQVRMREASRLLVETNLPVGEIARSVGFEDELYFSRRFHAERGMPATAYRRAYRPRDLATTQRQVPAT
jgi:AraC-like DNA-binding protein